MRIRASFSLTAVGLLCLAVTVLAQQPGQQGQRGGRGGPPGGFPGFGGGGFGGASRLGLLRIPEIQKELELADEQIAAIQKVQEELGRGRGGPGGPGGGDGKGGRGTRGGKGDNSKTSVQPSADWYFVQAQAQPAQGQRGGRGQITEEQRAQFEQDRLERARQERAKLAEILLPHQLKRLTEIYIQQAGVSALQDEDVAKELNISADQKTQMTKIRDEYRTKRGELFQGGGGGGDREALMAKMTEMRKAEDDATLGVLSAQQKGKFEEMKGKPFAMPEGAGRGGPGRGGPGCPGAPGGQRRTGNNNN